MKTFFTLLLLTSIFAATAQHTDVYVIQDSVLIPTRSGISLSAIIARKKVNIQPLPAVIFYTTYYQGKDDDYFAKISADKDYVGLVVYARGIRTNLKYYAPYENEGKDIYDIIDWVSKQSWCNGSVGMYGGSYTGFSQWATSKNIHPALKTIVPQVAVMPGFDVPMENNVILNLALYWPNDNIYRYNPIRRSLPFEWFEHGSSYRSLDTLAGHPDPIFQKWLEHPAYDTYWRSLVPTPAEFAKINIPVLSTTGYYDGAQIAAVQYFKLHTKYNQKANHYLVIGPYDHWSGQRGPSPKLMGYSIDPVANVNMQELAYQWLDYILKDGRKPEILVDKVNYQVMGTNEWKHAGSLDKINNDTLTLYLSNYALSKSKPKNKEYLTQKVDFKDRINQNNYYTPTITFDSLDASNGLVFKTQPFEKDFSINGAFVGNLYATINKKDMDVSIAMYELMPDGKYFFLTRYVGRASYSKDNTKRELLRPNEVEQILVHNTRFVSKKIAKGSRLVILLNINKNPFEVINYGSGKDVNDETIHDANDPLLIKWHNESFLKIPIWK